MSAKGYHHGDLRSALIAKALASLGKNGELPGWRALARACGVSQSAPYRHFASVDDLRYAVMAEGFRRLTRAILDASSRHAGLERLAAGSRAYMKFGIENPALYGVMFSTADAVKNEETKQASAAAYQTLLDAVAAVGVRDVIGTAFKLWIAMHGLVDLVRSGQRVPGIPKDRDGLVDMSLDLMIGYVKNALAAQR